MLLGEHSGELQEARSLGASIDEDYDFPQLGSALVNAQGSTLTRRPRRLVVGHNYSSFSSCVPLTGWPKLENRPRMITNRPLRSQRLVSVCPGGLDITPQRLTQLPAPVEYSRLHCSDRQTHDLSGFSCGQLAKFPEFDCFPHSWC